MAGFPGSGDVLRRQRARGVLADHVRRWRSQHGAGACWRPADSGGREMMNRRFLQVPANTAEFRNCGGQAMSGADGFA